ncbi:hypothetical protein [Blautia stercoris]|nr:hypothetical protein [Blautia stercoris]
MATAIDDNVADGNLHKLFNERNIIDTGLGCLMNKNGKIGRFCQ